MVRFQDVPVPIRRTRLDAVGRCKATVSTRRGCDAGEELNSLLGDDLTQLGSVLGPSDDITRDEALLHDEKHGGTEEPSDLQIKKVHATISSPSQLQKASRAENLRMAKGKSAHSPDVLDEETDQRAFRQRRARQIRLTRTGDLCDRFRRAADRRDDLSGRATCANGFIKRESAHISSSTRARIRNRPLQTHHSPPRRHPCRSNHTPVAIAPCGRSRQ